MKNLILALNFLIVVSIMFPAYVFAGDQENDARRLVAIQRIGADNYVQTLLLSDLVDLGKRLGNEAAPLSSSLNTYKDLDRFVKNLTDGFASIANLNSEQLKDVRAQVKQAIKQYTDLNREYFAETFLPTTIAIQKNNFLGTFDRYMDSYAYMCKVGRSDIQWDGGIPPNIRPDDLQFQINMSLGNAAPNQFNYEQFNYSNPTLSKVTEYAGYGFTATASYGVGMIANAWLGGATGAAMSSTMAAAAPFLIAAAAFAAIIAVAVIAMMIIGNAAYNEAMEDQFKAEKFRIENSLSSKDIQDLYREKCAHLVDVFTKMKSEFHKMALMSPEALNARFANLEGRSRQINSDLIQVANLGSQITLLRNYEAGMCTRDSGACRIIGNQLSMKTANPNQAPTMVDADLSKLDGMKEQQRVLFEKVSAEAIGTATDSVAKFIFVDAEQTTKTYDSKIFNDLKSQRLSAFNKLVELIDIEQSVPQAALNNEVKLLSEYLGFRKELLETVADAGRAVFGNVAMAEVRMRFATFQKNFANFYLNNGQVPEVHALGVSARYLEKFMEGQ